jgi:L-lactate utilization protein LutC
LADPVDPQNFKALLIGCEYLIANKGTVLICHHQLKDFKLEALPDFFIVYSGLDNFVNDVSEGMSQLKNKYADQLPTNITTLNVKNSKDENDFLSYGNSAKNLYLVIQER